MTWRAPAPVGMGADEAILRLRGSKADQLNCGEVWNQFATGSPDGVCAVAAFEAIRHHLPSRFGETPESREPLFRCADGSVLQQTTVVLWLARAAQQEGIPEDRVRSHSLRIGGDCALYHALGDLELVRRYGRWASAAFHVYPWESRETHTGVSTAIAADRTTLMAAKGLGADATRKGVKFAM